MTVVLALTVDAEQIEGQLGAFTVEIDVHGDFANASAANLLRRVADDLEDKPDD